MRRILKATALAFWWNVLVLPTPAASPIDPIHVPDLSPVELTIAPPAEILQDGSHSQTNPPDIPVTSSSTLAPPPAILTTRPSFTDAWLTVPQGSFQSENGATYTDNGNNTRSWVLPESLFRLGLTDHTEFRFSAPNYTDIRADQSGAVANTFGDLSIGISHHRTLPGKIDLALIPILNLPTGANRVSGNSVDPQCRLVVARSLTNKITLASQLDARWNTRKAATAPVVLNPTLIGYYTLHEKLSIFLEYGGFYYPGASPSLQWVQGGIQYLPTRRQQWDVRVATGLNKASPDILVGFGYSFRIDGLFGSHKSWKNF